ncbi:D-alanine--D-alanine ligase [Marinomonas sp. 15G1-11]|uniref:D-alanine--D-alanine ligase n=1 Tax=Marinomonas phaeophyticola TaxID=3004091 RepID=A0ABT4JXH2_9GAMM|nr:D-alanine--D-alanine ligase [Marinomonas sp. 15G1-11]MCZ2723098.1 D-alanine--D-alanine ligase [Marinomonas sp. 15G1-11]
MYLPSLKESKIAVIYGGRSSERDVSLQSGRLVARALLKKGYDIAEIDLYGSDGLLNPITQLQEVEFDLAYIALHGGEGEDGRIQALLEMLEKPYTGSRPLACGFAMDKVLSKKYWKGIGVPTPNYLSYDAIPAAEEIEQLLSYPVIVKPSREGSTIGINKALDRTELESALNEALHYDSEILVEQFVDGPEFTVTIIADEAYPVIGLKPAENHRLYDYNAKYIADDTQYLLPCGLSEQHEERVKSLALTAYRSLGCTGWGRVDVMQDKNQDFWVLEVNTSPGMTSHSLVPMAAAHLGIEYGDLVEKIALDAWERDNSL